MRRTHLPGLSAGLSARLRAGLLAGFLALLPVLWACSPEPPPAFKGYESKAEGLRFQPAPGWSVSEKEIEGCRFAVEAASGQNVRFQICVSPPRQEMLLTQNAFVACENVKQYIQEALKGLGPTCGPGKVGNTRAYDTLYYRLVADVRTRLEAQNAHVTMRFPYFMRRASPASGAVSNMDYACTVQGDLTGERFRMTLGVEVPVMTVCPCSLAISDQGAHSQRTVVRARCRFKGFMWLEELIAMAEAAGSSPVYSLLKREDEKHVTEAAFANPCFVEDVVRGVAKALEEHPRVTWYSVDVESFESIHNHCAVAGIERTKG